MFEGKGSERLKVRQGAIAVLLGLLQKDPVILCQFIKCLLGYWLAIDGYPLLYGMKMRTANKQAAPSNGQFTGMKCICSIQTSHWLEAARHLEPDSGGVMQMRFVSTATRCVCPGIRAFHEVNQVLLMCWQAYHCSDTPWHHWTACAPDLQRICAAAWQALADPDGNKQDWQLEKSVVRRNANTNHSSIKFNPTRAQGLMMLRTISRP